MIINKNDSLRVGVKNTTDTPRTVTYDGPDARFASCVRKTLHNIIIHDQLNYHQLNGTSLDLCMGFNQFYLAFLLVA